jgi:cytoskeleton protein RodZ
MSSFGSRLKHERESRGVTLREISAATNVGIHLLEALETNDFKSLPGGPFNKGFVRAYARHLGIDAEAAVDAYGREEKALGLHTPDAHRQEPEEEVKLFEMHREGKRTTMILDMVLVHRILMGAGAFLVIVLLAWLLWPSGAPADPTENPSVAATPTSVPAQPVNPPAGTTKTAAAPSEQPSGGAAGATAAPQTPAPVQDTATQDPQKPEVATLAEQTRDPAVTTTPPRQEVISTPPPEVEPAPAAAPTDSPLSITEYGVGTGVANRMLTGRGERFPVGTQVWFWTRTLGGSRGEILTHIWMHENGQAITYDRTLGGAHWRNSSRKSLISTSVGRWVVEARDSSGRVLARTAFQCFAP